MTTTQLPGATLYPFQVEGVEFIAEHKGRAIIGDVRGLGKTIQALAWAHMNPALRPIIVVCPAAIKRQWFREIQDKLAVPESDITIIQGRKAHTMDTPWVIVNYDVLRAHLGALRRLNPALVIADECHRGKNQTAQRTRALIALAQHPSVQSRVGLTGTMFLNRPLEGWSQVYMVNPSIWPKDWPYKLRYCDPQRINTTAKRDPFGKVLKGDDGQPIWNQAYDFKGASNTDELARILKERVLIRRTKDDVRSQLPPIDRISVPLDVPLGRYNAVLSAVRENLKKIRAELKARREKWLALEGANQERALAQDAERDSLVRLFGLAGAEIAKLRVEAGLAKVEAAADWLDDFMEEGTPVLAFTHHHAVSDKLREELNTRWTSAAKQWPAQAMLATLTGSPMSLVPPALDGRMTMKRREHLVDAFNAHEVPVLLAGITAMGEGFDGLQKTCSHVAFLELGWNPGVHDQAEGRVDRHGQTQPVTSYYLVAQGTIDESLARIIGAKSTVTASSYGEVPQESILETLMDEVIGEAI